MGPRVKLLLFLLLAQSSASVLAADKPDVFSDTAITVASGPEMVRSKRSTDGRVQMIRGLRQPNGRN